MGCKMSSKMTWGNQRMCAIFEDFLSLKKKVPGGWTTMRPVARGHEVIKGMCIEFSSWRRVGEKFSAHQEVLLFEKKGQKREWWLREGLKSWRRGYQAAAGPITYWKTGRGCKDGRQTSVYWCWYSVKKHIWKGKNGGAKEAPNVSTHTNRKWHTPSWPDTRKCQHPLPLSNSPTLLHAPALSSGKLSLSTIIPTHPKDHIGKPDPSGTTVKPFFLGGGCILYVRVRPILIHDKGHYRWGNNDIWKGGSISWRFDMYMQCWMTRRSSIVKGKIEI